MDEFFSIIFFIWIIYSVLEGVVRKKPMPKLPSEQDQSQQDSEDAIFEIPTLANDPNLQRLPVPSEEVEQIERRNSVADVFRRRQEIFRAISENQEQSAERPKLQNTQSQEKSALNLNLTPTDSMHAMMLSEIFGKPKALRRR